MKNSNSKELGSLPKITGYPKYLNQILWSLFFFIVFGVQQLYSWPLVKTSGWGGGSPFIDLRSVLHAANCSEKIGWDIYDPNNWGDCGYIYGSLLIRFIRWAHLSPTLTLGIGWVFIFLFSALSGYVFSNLKNLSRLQLGICVAIFVSPGAMLLLERGNFDILLILLLFVAAVCLQRKWNGIALTIIALSALFKFYTLPLLFALSVYFKSLPKIICSLSASFFVTFLVLIDLIRIKGEFPENVMASFGNQIFGGYLNYLGLDLSRFLRELIGFLAIFLCSSIIWKMRKNELVMIVERFQPKNLSKLTDYIIILFSFSYLICYFAGLNYDYRIPYLTIATLLLLPILISCKINCWPVLISLMIISWTSFNVGALQVFGELIVLVLTSYWILLYLIFFMRSHSFIRLRNFFKSYI